MTRTPPLLYVQKFYTNFDTVSLYPKLALMMESICSYETSVNAYKFQGIAAQQTIIDIFTVMNNFKNFKIGFNDFKISFYQTTRHNIS